jgi:dihydropteroate synthase
VAKKARVKDGPLAKIESIHLTRAEHLEKLMRNLGVDEGGVERMLPKCYQRVFLIRDISAGAANILKQEALAVGAESAIPRWAVTGSPDHCDVLLLGEFSKLRRLTEKLSGQPFGLNGLGKKLRGMVDDFLSGRGLIWRIKDRVLDFSAGPKVMGIINLTPDSFSDGGSYPTVDKAIERAKEMVAEGAGIIDVGAVSTRPGSEPPGEEEEWERLSGFLARGEEVQTPLSVDTYRSGIARRAIELGAQIINDISALRSDPQMAELCAETKVGLVLMHMQGEPANMQKDPQYKNVVGEIYAFLEGRLNDLDAVGIERERMAIDVGFGFGKTVQHNLALLGGLETFRELGRPLVVGVSRKTFLGKLLNLEVGERLLPSVVANLIALEQGASVLRVHDVSQTVMACQLAEACRANYVREILGENADV